MIMEMLNHSHGHGQMPRQIVHGYGWAGLWSTFASLIFLCSMMKQHMPVQIVDFFATLSSRIHDALFPYDTITIDERSSDFYGRSEAYIAADAYLGDSPCVSAARHLRAALADEDGDRVRVSLDDYEEVEDSFRGARVWWSKTKALPQNNVISMYPHQEERRSYSVTFHRRHHALVQDSYLPHVVAEGRAAIARDRQRRLFTNNPSDTWSYEDHWNSVKLEHPSTFASLAMDPLKKQEIIDDLEMFRDGKDYYASVGKAWKRGYLLHGPPGTGKSTMVAAMANFLDYDVYDLELTAVKNNTELRRLFIEMKGKSIMVIEDIDCSIDLTGKRPNPNKKGKKKPIMELVEKKKKKKKDDDSKVTLSGMLNFIDGLWSSCGAERIIVFTTNHREKLDPALIRRGRMDMHIEMSYCCFESFKVLAQNYLGVADHPLFCQIRQLLSEVNMSPADVAENLMPRSKKADVEACLAKLIDALKENALLPANNEEDQDDTDEEAEGDNNEEELNDSNGEEEDSSEQESNS